MKVYSSLKQASNDLFIKDLFQLGKSVKPKTYLKAFKELTEKKKVSQLYYKDNEKTIAKRKTRGDNYIVYELSDFHIRVFNTLKDTKLYQTDPQFIKACNIIISTYKNKKGVI